MWLNEALCFVSSSVVADSFVLRNRQLLVAAKRYAAVLEENRKTAFRQNHIPFRGDNYTIKLFSNVLTSLNLVDPISSHKARDISLSLMSSAFCIPKSISYIKLLHGLESSLLKIPEFFLTCALNLLLSNDFESILS